MDKVKVIKVTKSSRGGCGCKPEPNCSKQFDELLDVALQQNDALHYARGQIDALKSIIQIMLQDR